MKYGRFSKPHVILGKFITGEVVAIVVTSVQLGSTQSINCMFFIFTFAIVKSTLLWSIMSGVSTPTPKKARVGTRYRRCMVLTLDAFSIAEQVSMFVENVPKQFLKVTS